MSGGKGGSAMELLVGYINAILKPTPDSMAGNSILHSDFHEGFRGTGELR
jgi:hypothetical protein